MAKAPAYAPYAPPKWEPADVQAFQLMAKGECPPHLQQRALKHLIEGLCDTYGLSYRPGPDGDRDTVFAEGRRFVGLQIVKYLNLNIDAIERKTNG